MNNYRLQIDVAGNYFAKVIEQKNENDYHLYWQIDLKSDEPIVFSQFYSDTRFLIMNWCGRVWIFDASTKEKLYEHTFSKEICNLGVLSKDQQFFYVAYEGPESNTYIAKIDLAKLAVESDKEFESVQFLQLFEQYKDHFIFYRSGENWDLDQWEHYFETVNFETEAYQKYILPYPQLEDFDKKSPTIDAENGKAIMPYWGKVEIAKDDNGNDLFIFKIIIIDLDTFEIEKILPVRKFTQRQLSYFEDAANRTAENVQLSPDSEEYDEAMSDFCGNLNNIVLDDDGQSFWLCWRGGIVRRVDYDGNMSPLYAATSRTYNTIVGAFELFNYHSYLMEVNKEGLILQEHSNQQWMAIENIEKMDANIDEFIGISLTELPETETISIIKSEEAEQEEKERIYNVINFDSFDKDEDILKVLEEMLSMKFEQIGHYLAFLYKDKDGKEYQEYEFFERAIDVDGAVPLIEKIANKTLAFGIDGVYGANNEDHALFNLFFRLVLSDKKYAPMGFKYLEAVDLDHDVDNFGDMIGALEEVLEEKFEEELNKNEYVKDYYDYFGY